MKNKRRKEPGPDRTAFWSVLLFITVLFGVAYWAWTCYYLLPQFNHLVIKKNDQSFKLFNGETLHLHPRDSLRILNISTNICLNRGIRLVSTDLDVNAIIYEEMPLFNLLPHQDTLNQYTFQIDIKYYNRDLGVVYVAVEPFVEDWIDRVNRIIDRSQRIIELERALKLFPDNGLIRNALIEAYKASQMWPQASALMEQMVKEKPNQQNLTSLLDLYQSMSNTEGIISVLKRLLENEPSNADIRLQLATTLEAAKKWRDAIHEYETLLSRIKKEESAPIYKRLGYLYVQTGQLKEAIDRYLNASELETGDANLYDNLSQLYEKMGQKDKADHFLKKAIRLRSEDTEGRLRLAERLIEQGKPEEAESYLKEVLRKSPDSLESLLLMIKVAEKKGNKEELKGIYERILSLDPKNETVMYNLGVLEYETGHFSKSLVYFEKLAALHPEDIQTHSFLFGIYRKLNKDDLAFKEAETLIALNPKEVDIFYYAFDYLNSRGRYKEMAAIMQKGLESNPQNMDLRKYLILAYLKTDREALAMDQMQEVLKLRPQEVPILLQLARLQEDHGKFEEALQSYQKVLHMSSGHREAKEGYLRVLLELGKIKEKRGDIKGALKDYKTILEISPGNKEAEEAYLRLRLKGLTVDEKE